MYYWYSDARVSRLGSPSYSRFPPHALAVSKANAKPSSGKTAQSARKSASLFRLSDAGAPARPLNHSVVIWRRHSARVMRALRGSTLMAPARKYLILLVVGRLARAAPGCGPVRHRRCHQGKSNILTNLRRARSGKRVSATIFIRRAPRGGCTSERCGE